MSQEKNNGPIYDKADRTFARKMKPLVGRLKRCREAICTLIGDYASEHGNRYGDKLYVHIATLADISARTARQYHNLYRLTTEYKDNADLHNLTPSVRYEIARLLLMGDEAQKLIPLMASKAKEQRLTTDQVAVEVSAILDEFERIHGRIIRRGGPGKTSDVIDDETNEAEAPSKGSHVFTKDDEVRLTDVAPVLELLSFDDVQFDKGAGIAATRLAVITLCNELVPCLRRMIELGEADGLLPVIRKMAKEFIILSRSAEPAKQNGKRRKAA